MGNKFKDFLYGLGGIGFMILILGGFAVLIMVGRDMAAHDGLGR